MGTGPRFGDQWVALGGGCELALFRAPLNARKTANLRAQPEVKLGILRAMADSQRLAALRKRSGARTLLDWMNTAEEAQRSAWVNISYNGGADISRGEAMAKKSYANARCHWREVHDGSDRRGVECQEEGLSSWSDALLGWLVRRNRREGKQSVFWKKEPQLKGK